jgi:hypothetical protein
MKAWGSEGKTPRILVLDSKCRWMVSLMFRPIYLPGKGFPAQILTLSERWRFIVWNVTCMQYRTNGYTYDNPFQNFKFIGLWLVECFCYFRHFQLLRQYTTGWTIGRSRFDPRQGQIFLLAPASRPALGPTQPPIRWVPGVKRGRGVTLTTHPHLVPRLRMSRSYTSSPPMCLHGV